VTTLPNTYVSELLERVLSGLETAKGRAPGGHPCCWTLFPICQRWLMAENRHETKNSATLDFWSSFKH